MPRGQENSISVKTISDAYKHTSQDVPDELIEREDWNQEIVQVQICQRIQDEIERLEKTRTDSNPFLLSSDLKIQILNRLLQLILAPESLDRKSVV